MHRMCLRPLSDALTLLALTLVAVPAARAQQAQLPVSGTVTSALDSRPLPAGRITVAGTDVQTTSGANGGYALKVPSLQDTLVFNYIGFHELRVAIAGRSIVNVAMHPTAITMQEVVVTGYGQQQQKDVTGSIATLDSATVTPIATPSVSQAIQGRVAGVQVEPSSGQPGAQAVIRIRGVGTLNDASPLYVVDGMLLNDISYLDPNDIASVEVLKDASATAIYGSRGANGVILITTKRGKLDTPTRFGFRAYYGSQSVLHKVPLVDGHDYAILANELAANTGAAPYFPNPDTIGVGTNWQNQIFQKAPIESYELSASGGTDKIDYYFSADYVHQAGVLPKSTYNRVTLRLNNDYHLTGHLKVGHNIAFQYVTNQNPPDVLSMIYRADPTIPPMTASGTFSNGNVRSSAGNPAAAVYYTRNSENQPRIVGDVYGELNFLGSFTLRSSFSVDNGRSLTRTFVPVYTVSPTQQNTTSNLTVDMGNSTSWLWENTLTFDHESPTQRINAVAGVTAQSFYGEDLSGTRIDIVGNDPSLWYLNAGSATGQSNSNTASNWRMLSGLVRLNYAYKDRYLFTGTLRVDGSSRFGSDNRYGYFPSFALGWDLKQTLLQSVGAVTAFKLRGSWGETGNDKIGEYPGIPVVTGNLNAVFGTGQTLNYGASPIDLANPLVKWERTKQTDVGADMSFLGGRLDATADYYRRVTDGILVQVPIPLYVGVATNTYVNAAQVESSGFEATLDLPGPKSGPVGYDLGVNASTVHNEVLQLGQGNKQILAGGLGNEVTFSTRTAVGHPIGCFWGFKVAGVFQSQAEIDTSAVQGGEQPGDLKFADLNHTDSLGNVVAGPDHKITEADKTFLGCPEPTLVYGFNGALTVGPFSLSANFAGQAGNKIFNGKKAVRFGVDNFQTSFLNRWHGQGTSNTEPRVTNAGHNYQASDRFIESGAFLLLQAAQLSYRVPDNVARTFGFTSAKIYLNGTNLFDSTAYTGYTPQIPGGSVIASGIDLGIFPPARTITGGVDVTF